MTRFPMHQILNLAVVKAESLGNVRKHNTITGFSANRKAESLGKIRNRSGRQMGDNNMAFFGNSKLRGSLRFCKVNILSVVVGGAQFARRWIHPGLDLSNDRDGAFYHFPALEMDTYGGS